MKKVIISSGDIRLDAGFNDSPTANAIYEILPVTGSANVWGDEIYFTIPVHLDQSSDALQEVEVGDMAFWPAGDAFCIFFGPTPVSTGDKPKAYSPVNVFGSIEGDATVLRDVSNGDAVTVSIAE
jgi:hypothetical protein